MRNFGYMIAALGMVTMTSPAAAAEIALPASSVSFVGGTSLLPANLDPATNSQAVLYDFDTHNAGAGIFTGGSGIFSAAGMSGVAAHPAFNSENNFAAVVGGGTYTLAFASAVQVFSFALGSLDSYNSLQLKYFDGSTTTLTGGQIIGGSGVSTSVVSSGNQGLAATNGRVVYDFGGTGGGLTQVVFSSANNSFEFDNIATAAPEPAAWGMMILGFGLAGGALRIRRREDKLARA